MYEARPLTLTPRKIEKIFDEMLRIETMWNDYQKGCPEYCGECQNCIARKVAISRNLASLDSMSWEVWKDGDFVGILFLTDIVSGHDALAHFAFWDGDMRGKAALIENMIEEVVFNGNLGLHRLTVKYPAHEHRMIGYLKRYLGFEEEGRLREAQLWRGKWEDVAILGRINARRTTDHND